jgi:hypothetical protein
MFKTWGMLSVLASLFSEWGSMCEARDKETPPPAVETGYLTSFDGTRLFYTKVGGGPEVVLIPGRLFLFPDFQILAKRRTLIAYDMRNRGQSDAVRIWRTSACSKMLMTWRLFGNIFRFRKQA